MSWLSNRKAKRSKQSEDLAFHLGINFITPELPKLNTEAELNCVIEHAAARALLVALGFEAEFQSLKKRLSEAVVSQKEEIGG